MTDDADEPVYPLPGGVRVAGLLLIAQALGLMVVAVLTVTGGLRHSARPTQMWAQCGYYLLLAAAVVAVAYGLLSGRRWARSPALVIEIIALAIGLWMAIPSGQVISGLVLCAVSISCTALLLTAPASAWAAQRRGYR